LRGSTDVALHEERVQRAQQVQVDSRQ
jgi:hypothetical protein